MLSVDEFLTASTKILAEAGIESARLDCLILLEDELGKDRASLLAHGDTLLDHTQQVTLHKKIMQRTTNYPLAYIRGKVPFYGREFIVNEHVLVPRPESEILIELLKALPIARPRIADIGTGSGCLAVTASLELPSATVAAYDIDTAALQVAKQNAAALHAVVQCRGSDLLKDVTEHYDVLLANLPYVPGLFPINKAAQYEPKRALFAGPDGLSLYKRLLQELAEVPKPPRYLITESLESQQHGLATLARNIGYIQVERKDLAQLFERAA